MPTPYRESEITAAAGTSTSTTVHSDQQILSSPLGSEQLASFILAHLKPTPPPKSEPIDSKSSSPTWHERRERQQKQTAMQQRHGGALLALCLLLCCASCQGRTPPGMVGEGRAVRFEAGVAQPQRGSVSPASGRGLAVARVHKLPEGLPVLVSGGARAERLLRSVPSPGVGH
ncbi:unnamed protein product [Urochloa humidicola]